MAEIVDEIFSDWQELSSLLLKTQRKTNKDNDYPFFKNKKDLSLFMLKSILSLFSLEQQQEIQQTIKGSLLILKKIDVKTHSAMVINEDDFLSIKNYLERLENILKSGNENILFLVETNQNIAQFISQKQEEINHKAGLVLTPSQILCKHPFQLNGARLSEHQNQS
ncbi:Uncharacterised protein [Canicola haemoglobinophilus]|uniref:Uncharacterized protein n=1 Tax=Canicola haemoglobinophilus TaxID=733 RepID=A0AB38H5I4_9PAST|nr:hypothetical protein [Canicola haemoglobinophilus]STO54629.1 Uncharacterised protein [Canicola haemoglobinophilus]STO67596.1 Uncharacterised protein [Canicola haemoglobinophilus]